MMSERIWRAVWLFAVRLDRLSERFEAWAGQRFTASTILPEDTEPEGHEPVDRYREGWETGYMQANRDARL